jgi:hypothetical protein
MTAADWAEVMRSSQTDSKKAGQDQRPRLASSVLEVGFEHAKPTANCQKLEPLSMDSRTSMQGVERKNAIDCLSGGRNAVSKPLLFRPAKHSVAVAAQVGL